MGPGGGERRLMSEINVTPFVDVMLVLLVIFMVTVPMMMHGLDVNLPQVDAAAIRSESERVVVTMTADGAIYIDEFKVPLENLGLKVKRIMEVKGIREVFLRADQGLAYGRVAKVMAEMRRAGVMNLGLVTEPEKVTAPEGS